MTKRTKRRPRRSRIGAPASGSFRVAIPKFAPVYMDKVARALP